MKKTNFKHLIVILLVLVLVCSMSLVLVACQNNDDNSAPSSENKKEETKTDTALIKNGNFATYTGTAPFQASTWKTSSSSSIKTNYSGVVHANDLFAVESSAGFENLSTPGKANNDDEDDAVYMIYNKEADTSSIYQSFTTVKGGYYKVEVSFKVVGGVEELKDGAYIYFSGNVCQKFGPFVPEANKDWQTVTLYVEASYAESQTVTVTLSMGDTICSTTATGCVFFDNAVATKITKSDYEKAQQGEVSELTAFYSMLTPDGDFINNASVATPATSNTWSKSMGADEKDTSLKDENIKFGVVDTENFSAWKNFVGELKDDNLVSPKTPYQFIADNGTLGTYDYDLSKDTNILLLSNYQATLKASSTESAYTAVAAKSKSQMTIELGTVYELKVWVCTKLVYFKYGEEVEKLDENGEVVLDDNGNPVKEREANTVSTDPSDIDFGARIVVTGIGDDNAIENINTNGEWQEFTFVIVGHENRWKNINLELWLGKDGKDANLACGSVMFDNVRLIKKQTFDESQRQQIIDNYSDAGQYNPENYKIIDVKSVSDSSLIENTIPNSNFQDINADGTPEGWELSLINDVKANVSLGNQTVENPDVLVAVINTTSEQAGLDNQGITEEDAVKEYWNNKYHIDENPSAPYETLDNVLMINNVNASAYQLKLPTTFEINPNLHYRLGLWIKTVNIPSGKGATITLKNDTKDTTLDSFTTVNTASYEDEITNGYAEYVFYIQGSNFSSTSDSNTISASLLIKLGDGNALTPKDFVSGAIFIANVNLEQVSYDEYNTVTTGDYTKKKSLSSNLGTISNGSFNSFEYNADSIDQTTGKQIDYLKPSNWALDSAVKSTLNKDEEKVFTGIVNATDTDLVNNLFGERDENGDLVSSYQIFTDWVQPEGKLPIDYGKPNVLAINVAKPIEASLIYSSSSISLSKDTYYVFKLNAMIDTSNIPNDVQSKCQIVLEANNNSAPISYTLGENSGLWEEITFGIKTGMMTAPSVTIKIYVGDYLFDSNEKFDEDKQPKYQGKIFIDNVTYKQVTEEKYNEEHTQATSYTVESFDTTSKPTTVSGPNSSMWTGTGEKHSSASNRANENNVQYAGIIVKGSTDRETLKLTEDVKVVDEDGKEKTETKTIEGSVLTEEQIWVNSDTSMIVINNQKASYYSYKNKNSITLDKNSYYKLTVWARTLGISEGEYATLRVENSTDKYEINVNTEYKPQTYADGSIVKDKYTKVNSEWTEYTFYFKTAESTNMTSVYLTMLLGKSDAKVQGTAFFDNVSLVKLDDATEFTTAYTSTYKVGEDGLALTDENGNYVLAEGSEQYQLTNRVIRADDAKKDNTSTEQQTNTTKPKSNNLSWLYISSIVIAGVMIIVIAFYLIRKYVPKSWFRRTKSADYVRKEEKEDKKTKKDDSSDEFKD